MGELEQVTPQAVATLSEEFFESKSRAYKEASRSQSTRRAYHTDWVSFESFCRAIDAAPMPATAETVQKYIIYLRDIKGLKLSSIQRHLSTVSVAHKSADFPSPTQTAKVQMVLDGMKNTHGVARTPKEAADIDKMRLMMEHVPQSPIGIRDRALLLLGFAGAFRRSELVGLNFDDIKETKEGLAITLRHSKTDQKGEGFTKPITYGANWDTCPIRAWHAWRELMAQSGITEGPAFRPFDRHGHILGAREYRNKKAFGARLSDKSVALIVKKYAESVGLDASQFAGHSLRSGFVTSAVANEASDREIMAQTGHKSRTMVDLYVRQANLFKQNAVTKLGL